VPTDNETSLGEHIEGGIPGYGRTLDEAIADAYDNAKGAGFGPDWYAIEAVYVLIENPIREYKVVISSGSG
jgi:hypothetical protein